MKTKIIFLTISLIFLIGISGFVSADFDEATEYRTNITLEKGWNLVSIYALGNQVFEEQTSEMYKNELKEKGIKSVFIYNRIANKYIQVYPNRDNVKMKELENQIGSERNDYQIQEFAAFVSSSMWVYSNKRQRIEYSTWDGPAPLQLINLKSGWNILSITPQMISKNLNEIKGNCSFNKVYFWNAPAKKWFEFSLSEKIDREYLGYGLVIKSSFSCNLVDKNAPIKPSFPNQIGEFSLKSKRIETESSECDYLGTEEVCGISYRLEYISPSNLSIHIMPIKITSGKEAFVKYYKNHSSEQNVDNVPGVYRGEDSWELHWFTNKEYDAIGTQNYQYHSMPEGGISSELVNASTKDSVTQWFLNKYPPII